MRFHPKLLLVHWNLTAAALVGLSGLWIAISIHYGTRDDWLPAVPVLLYFVALGIAAAPDVWRRIHTVRAMRRRQLHIFAGTCPECGYSLHASIGKCPECGLPIAPDARSSLSQWHHVRFRPDISDAAKAALSKAREAAVRMRHDYLGTEHLLLGVLRVVEEARGSEGIELGLSADEIEEEIAELVEAGEAEMREEWLCATPAANRVLYRALELQRAEGLQAALPRHLLQALQEEPGCVAAHLLMQAGGRDTAAEGK